MLKTRKFVIQETPYFVCSAFCSSFWRLCRDPPQARECSVNSAMTTTLHIQELGSPSRMNPTQRTLPISTVSGSSPDKALVATLAFRRDNHSDYPFIDFVHQSFYLIQCRPTEYLKSDAEAFQARHSVAKQFQLDHRHALISFGDDESAAASLRVHNGSFNDDLG